MGKTKKSKIKRTGNEETEDRFSAAETRPQFRSIKENKSKVVLDERFSSVLTDPRFQLQEKDKYGRKKKKRNAKEELSNFYAVEGEEVEKEKRGDNDDSETSGNESENPAKEGKEGSDSESDSDGKDDPASRIAYLTAFSRGELDVSSSSDEDDSSDSSDDDDDDDDGEDPVHGTAGVLDPSNKSEEIEISYDSSPYLVVTNMDWENVRAVDLFTILSSFSPPGSVKRVQVYKSDFGIERMEQDKLHGPSDIWKKNKNKNATKGLNDALVDSDSEVSDDDDDSVSGDSMDDSVGLKIESDMLPDESDFDPEKLRAYEASKMKYFFAVVQFSDPEQADIAYREVDGMEFEHSSSAIDLRTLPADEVDDVVTDRPMRDEATFIPSNYEPPDFIVSALQQTTVQCTWDQGDTEREKKLTQYGSGGWNEMTETDDLKVYLASDASSDDESEDEKAGKGSKMRKLLGLESGSDDDDDEEESDEASDSSDDSDDEGNMNKEIKFIPGQKSLEEKIRNKLQSKDEPEELTPWQKYQEKRKQKRKERRQAARNKRSSKDESSDEEDDFFMDSGKGKKGSKKTSKEDVDKKKKHELELLLAGEDDEEQARDYDIRGIQRMEKNKGKKLKGSRKRKEEKLNADVSGKDFKINVKDNRFAAVLEGSDSRFGIDKTDPNYKDTSAMREILTEQTKRRKKKRQRSNSNDVVADVSVDTGGKSVGASALSSLVSRLKTKVAKTSQ